MEAEKRRRHSIRLDGYDYSQEGAYFVTICTQNKEQFFEDKNLSAIVENCWTDIPKHFPAFDTDVYVVMPNHLHGIILIHSLGRGEAFEGKCLQNRRYQPSNASPVRVP